jgi:hypothetical protein
LHFLNRIHCIFKQDKQETLLSHNQMSGRLSNGEPFRNLEFAQHRENIFINKKL